MIYCIPENEIDKYEINDILSLIDIIFKDYQYIADGFKEIIIEGGDYEKVSELFEYLKLTNEDNLAGNIDIENEKIIIENFTKIVKDYRTTISLIKGSKQKNEENNNDRIELEILEKGLNTFIY